MHVEMIDIDNFHKLGCNFQLLGEHLVKVVKLTIIFCFFYSQTKFHFF